MKFDVYILGRLLLLLNSMLFLFQIVSFLSIFFIIVSILSFCLKTHPSVRIPVVRNVTYRYVSPTNASISPSLPKDASPHNRPVASGCTEADNCYVASGNRRAARRTPLSRTAKTTTVQSSMATDKSATMVSHRTVASKVHQRENSGLLLLRSTEPHPFFFYIECVCNAWFSLELIVRLSVAPSRWKFLRTPVNIIELIASASFYLDFLMTYLKRENDVLEFFRSDDAHRAQHHSLRPRLL